MPLIPASWLARHVELPTDLTAEQLAADLVKVGLEEEEIHRSEVSGPVVVGRVLTISKEEQKNGKLINYCRVDVGEHNDAPGEGKEPADVPSRGIICGAHNFVEGDYVVVSLPGAELPGGFQISARKTYGHISDGMICSVRELGIGEDHDGILVLASSPEEASEKGLPGVGEDALDYLGLAGETLEINVTPDRGYCFAMRGVAREYAHSTGAAFTDHGLPENLAQPLPEPTPDGFPVEVRDDAPLHDVIGCDRFVTRIVRDVNPQAPSPQWLRDELTQAGMRPISLAVDATNYVMLDLGQPMHAYDLDKVNAPIVVRRAHEGEKLTTLDDIERTLHPEDLLITDGEGATRVLALAGVMGGADTEITDSTVNVLIEAAHFDQITVARTARRHRLPSESSKRFERGVDPQLPPVAAQRVVDLLVEYGGGTADPAVFDLNTTTAPEAISFTTSEVARLTGLAVDDARIREILEEIGCSVSSDDDAGRLVVQPPTWRPDLVGPAHLVEEVARLVGYDEIASKLPIAPAGHGLTLNQRRRRDVLRSLAELGWTEVQSYPFVSGAVFDLQGMDSEDPRREAVRLANPLQAEAPYMRTSLLDSLLSTAKLNVARGNPEVAISEAGTVTRPAGLAPAEAPGVGMRPSDEAVSALAQATPSQPMHVAGVACGVVNQGAAGLDPVVWDWRDAVAAVRSAAAAVGVEIDVSQAADAPYHPGRCAQVTAGETIIGYAGELAPSVCQAFDLPPRSAAFEIDLDALFASRGEDQLSIKPVLVRPVAKEDIALVVPTEVTVSELEDLIRESAGDLLESVRLFDVYEGDQVDEGKKSLAFALRLRASDRTLTADDTAGIRTKIVKAARRVGGELRS